MDFLDQLNSTQREAVTHIDGPSLIVAGAGSGKTRVLTYRVAYLLTQGVPAGNILALTFTNKAAREMKERICRLVPPADARYLWMGTFHHVCTRLLRRNAELLGFTPDFTIYDTQDMKSLLKSICKERGLDDKVYKPAVLLERISMAKNMMISPERYALDSEIQRRDRESRLYELATIYDLYQLRLKAANAMDFDDLLLNMLRLIDQHADVREQLQQQFRYVLVDEYQDTNYVQYLLVSRLAEPQNNICVVGDDAQSIYSFRGADIRNILNFRQRYPDAQIFKLERNYRSTRNIVDAANSLIHHNQHQIEKNVYSENDEGQLLSLQSYMDDRAEAEGVARQIQNLKKGSSRLSPLAANRFTYDDFAILYRTNAQSRAFEGELRKRNIPYRIYGGISFYQRKEIKDTLGYFRLAVNPRDNEALLRIIAFPGRGIGETTMRRVAANAIEHHRCYLDVMRTPEETGLDVSPATQKKIRAFAQQIDELGTLSEQMDAFGFAEHVLRTSGVQTALAMDRTPEGIDRAQNVQELLNAIHEFVEMRAQEGIDFTPITDFLSEVSLQTDQDENLQDTTERVTLMTVHAAKGLEFPVVFIVGLEENLFPSQYCVRPSEIEEERRLLYVAITRSMEQCHLSLARQRFRNGSVTFASPSRFLSDIDRRYIEMVRPASTYRAPSFSSTPRFVQPARPQVPVRNESVSEAKTDASWHSGDRVHHSAFGNGVVSRVYHDEATGNDKIEITFESLGTKTLLLSYAKLERI